MNKKVVQRKLRQKRGRAKIYGTKERPRLNVYRSLNCIYAQIINDEQSKTLVSASSLKKKTSARDVGKDLAKKAIENKIKKVVFDKGGFKYHGQIKELAEGAREGGLDF